MAGKVKPIPEGCHTVTPYLTISDPAAAIAFYKKAFGAEEVMRLTEPKSGAIMHAEIKIGDSMIMLGGEFPQGGKISPTTLKGTTVTIHLYVDDCDAMIGRAVSAGATGTMPPADMFWGDRMGAVLDPYGHAWSIATHKVDLTPEQMKKAFAEAMSSHKC